MTNTKNFHNILIVLNNNGVIYLDPSWLDYNKFLTDMGECPSGRTYKLIIKNNRYEPGNLMWGIPSTIKPVPQRMLSITQYKTACASSNIDPKTRITNNKIVTKIV